MDALKLPKSTPEEKEARKQALEAATLYATQVPLQTMEAAVATFPLLETMERTQFNVRINAAGLSDRAEAERLIAKAAEIAETAIKSEAEVLKIVNQVLSEK